MPELLNKTVREYAVEMPNATRVFEKMGIDYCCGGGQTLADACATAGVAIEAVLNKLEGDQSNDEARGRDFQSMSLGQLITHILETHHEFTRSELARLSMLTAKVVTVHGANHEELNAVQSLYNEIHADLTPHMIKEEQMLFPYILQLESSNRNGMPAPVSPFGTVRNPIRVMSLEHDRVGALLKELRAVTGNFAVPPDGCFSYKTLYRAFEEFEADIHLHIHLENNILFPKAVELEASFE